MTTAEGAEAAAWGGRWVAMGKEGSGTAMFLAQTRAEDQAIVEAERGQGCRCRSIGQ